MTHNCPHCGKEINPAKMLGAVRTPKKEAAWKANGERLKQMYANARKVGAQVLDHGETKVIIGQPQSFVDPEFAAQLKKDNPALPFIAPKGSFSKEDLRALLAGGAFGTGARPSPNGESISLSDIPSAPFDVDIDGEPHRVTQLGSRGLYLFYVSPEGQKPIRPLQSGELERLWEKRNK